MIPTFKTYLKESVWGDIRKKSLGQEERIEDGVDNMDWMSFYKYLKEKYDKDAFDIGYSEKGPNTASHIWAEVIEDVILSAYYNEYTGLITRVTLRWFNCRIDDDILRELNKRYILQDDKLATSKKHIFEKETPVENHTFVDVLEFLIENKDSLLIEESVWGDIRKKSLGQEVREEDNIDRLDMNEFEQYLKSIYKVDRLTGIDHYKKEHIYIPVCRESGYYCSIRYYKPDNYIEIRLFIPFSKFNDAVEEQYPCYPIDNNMYRLKNENHEVLTNSFVCKMIDFMLDHIYLDEKIIPVLTKKENDT